MRATLQDALRAALRDVGPMTINEMALHTERNSRVTWGAVVRLRTKKQIYICAWAKPQGGGGGRRAAIYALGDLPDVPEPPRDSRDKVNVRYRERHNAAIKARAAVRRAKASGKDTPTASPWQGLLR